MTEYGSNQYPRLPWERNPDMVHGGFIARPHGPDGGWARIYYDRVQVSLEKDDEALYWWVWAVVWGERFSQSGHVAAKSRDEAKQQAADRATIAYWDQMEATEGWQPPKKVVPYVDLVALHFWERVERWIAEVTDLDIYNAQWERYRTAANTGQVIIDPEEDRRMAARFRDRWWSVRSRILWPENEPYRRW